jgi:molecular chaperone GrpE
MSEKNKSENQEEVVEETTEQLQEESTEVVSKEEYDLLNDKFVRLVAEFDNYKRRTQKEKQAYVESGKIETAKTLVSLLDDFIRAGELSEGMALIKKKIETALTTYGVKKIESLEQPFDPEIHEALTQIPVEGKKGLVVEVMEEGYTINDNILRFAKVVVGS